MRELRRHERCRNCDTPVPGNFCGQCGQENTDYHVSMRQILGDAADELFQLESRLWRSLWNLVRRPGRLTVAYVAGQRARYTTPLRLYLLCVTVYFGVMALVPNRGEVKVQMDFGSEATDQKPPSAFEKRMREHLGYVDGNVNPQEVSRRVRAALTSTMPKVVALLVPLFALFTMTLFRRPKRFYVEHLVFALHLHALALLVLLPFAMTRGEGPVLVGLVLVWVWMALALKALFEQSWLRTFVKASVLGVGYSICAGMGIAGAAFVGIWYG